MDGKNNYGKYYNKVVQVSFKEGTESRKHYGSNVTGHIVTPILPLQPITIKDNTYNYRGIEGDVQELTRMCLISDNAGKKTRSGNNTDPEFRLLNEGFDCRDIDDIEII